jgi:hypothetical protein
LAALARQSQRDGIGARTAARIAKGLRGREVLAAALRSQPLSSEADGMGPESASGIVGDSSLEKLVSVAHGGGPGPTRQQPLGAKRLPGAASRMPAPSTLTPQPSIRVQAGSTEALGPQRTRAWKADAAARCAVVLSAGEGLWRGVALTESSHWSGCLQ